MEPTVTEASSTEVVSIRAFPAGSTEPRLGTRSLTVGTRCESVKTPHYFRRKAQGEILPVNPLNEYKLRVLHSDGSMVSHHTSSVNKPYRMEGNIPLFCALSGQSPDWTQVAEPPEMDESAFNALAVTAISNARQELFDSLTFLAELEKTIEMLSGCVERYTRRLLIVEQHARVAYRTWKRGSLAPKASANFADFFSSCWMEWRYGITPLMCDIDAMYKQLRELDAMTHRVRGAAYGDAVVLNKRTTVSSGSSVRYDGGALSGGWLWSVEKSVYQTVRPRAKTLIELANSFRCTADPLVTGLEVIPYSWMAEWFINIGELIRTFSPFQPGRVASCSVSVLLDSVVSHNSVKPSDTRYIKLDSFTPSLFELRKTQHVRMAFSPQVELNFRIELSWRRVLDLIALLFSRLAKALRMIPQDATGFNWRHLRV